MKNQMCGSNQRPGKWAMAMVCLMALIATSCGSSGDGTAVVNAQPDETEQTAAEPSSEVADELAPTAAPEAAATTVPETETETDTGGGAPPNDLLANAVVIDGGALPFTAAVDTTTATSDSDDEELCPAPATDATVWYSLTPTTDMRFTVSPEGSDYPAGVTWVTGEPGSLTGLHCEPDEFLVVAEANVTNYFQVFDDGTGDGVGGGNLTFTVVEADPVTGVDHGVEGVTPIVITTDSTFDNDETNNTTGTFDVPQGADAFGCTGGSLTDFDHGAPLGIDKVLTCESGTRSGTVTIRFEPIQGGPWRVADATGDFAGLAGGGSWEGTADDQGGAAETLSGAISFDGGFAQPVETFPRLVSRFDDACAEGHVTIDGLHEFATVDGELRSLDLVTQEITSHGQAPEECVVWLGDEARVRRVVISDDAQHLWFGPFDGPSDSEVTLETPRLLLSRTFAANRLVFLEPEMARLVIVDATTGEPVGEPIVGGFDNGRDFTSIAVSGDETLLAIGGSNPGGANGDGRVFVLDAESGVELYTVDIPSPVTSMVFDDQSKELVVASFTGDIHTIDLGTRAVVSEVTNSSGATIGAIGIRDDGLLVTHTDRAAALIDRSTGPTGVVLALTNSGAARIRPDGTINSLSDDGFFEVYVIDG